MGTPGVLPGVGLNIPAAPSLVVSLANLSEMMVTVAWGRVLWMLTAVDSPTTPAPTTAICTAIYCTWCAWTNCYTAEHANRDEAQGCCNFILKRCTVMKKCCIQQRNKICTKESPALIKPSCCFTCETWLIYSKNTHNQNDNRHVLACGNNNWHPTYNLRPGVDQLIGLIGYAEMYVQ